MSRPSRPVLVLGFSVAALILSALSCGTPTGAPPPTTAPTQTIPPTTAPVADATISGMISYPSEGWCPEMTLYARNTADSSQTSINWNTGTCEFSMTVPAPGEYILFAWPVGEFSALGFMLSADCISPDPLTVASGDSITDVYLSFCPETAPLP